MGTFDEIVTADRIVQSLNKEKTQYFIQQTNHQELLIQDVIY